MIDFKKAYKAAKPKIKTIMKIDALIDAGNEYVVVDGFERKPTKFNPEGVIFHDQRSDKWFWSKGADQTKLVAQWSELSDEAINEAFEKSPQLWRLSKVLQVKDYKTNTMKSYRPTEFMGAAAEFELLGEEMEDKNGDGQSGTED